MSASMLKFFFVYLIINQKKKRTISYVGYTNDVQRRVMLHNISKGAKFTRGRKWRLIYKKKYLSKQKAMSAEYNLKKNYYLRKQIIKKSLN